MKYLKSKLFICIFYVLLSSNLYSTDAVVTPTYDEIIVKPTTTSIPVPIYDTPMELHTNTAYDRPIINKDIINVHNNDAYGPIMM